jgi:hypothetical protein
LHLSHIRLTDALTFIVLPACRAGLKSRPYIPTLGRYILTLSAAPIDPDPRTVEPVRW